MNIDAFIDKLAQSNNLPHVFNQYSPDSPQNKIRRENLGKYLQRLAAIQPQFLLVGEAPGYRGARLSGIPFVSPALLTELPKKLGTDPMTIPDEWPHIQREASATIMWDTLAQVTAVPLIWNVFPFHPYRSGWPQSNRRPIVKELEAKRPLFHEFFRLFSVKTIIAVGNTASQTLSRWQITHEKARHPSHGGKAQFQSKIWELLG